MKKDVLLFLFLLLLLVSGSSVYAETVITFQLHVVNDVITGDKGVITNAGGSVITKNGITIATDYGDFTGVVSEQKSIGYYRFFKNSNDTITSTVGNITKVVFTCTHSKSDDKNFGPSGFKSASVGKYTSNGNIGTWEGNAPSFTFDFNNKMFVTKIEVTVDGSVSPSSETVTISSAGWATYVTKQAVDFTDSKLKAFTAKYDATANSITLSQVSKVPANTAIVLKGNAGTYILTRAESADAVKDKDLTFKTTDYVVEAEKTIYVLANKNNICGFYPLAQGEKLPAYKGYIYISNSSKAKSVYGLSTTTSIHHVVVDKARKGVRYNLAGQPVSEGYKGVVIENGKKIIVK